MFPRTFFVLLLAALALRAPATLRAQTNLDPNEGARFDPDPTTPGGYIFSWWGRAGRTYFLQQSDDLSLWTYLPVIEPGGDQVIQWGFTSPAPKFFLRLRWSDIPTDDPFNADFDGDGVTNLQELQQGTNPLSAALDPANGLPLDWEKFYGIPPGTDPNADPDGDGLTNLQEYQLGTNPLAFSTAGDGVSDGWKVAHGLDPKARASTAGDGIPDSWKLQYGYSVQYSIAGQDNDNDGLTNLQEFQMGTDPHNPDTDGDGMWDGSDPNPTIFNPAAPSGLTVVTPDEARYQQGEIAREAIDYTKVEVRWTVNSPGHVTGFLIERKVSIGPWERWQENVAASARAFPDTGLLANQNRYYRVTAFNQNSNGTKAFSTNSAATVHQIPFLLRFDAKVSYANWTNPGWRQFDYNEQDPTAAAPHHYLHREFKTDGVVSITGKLDVSDAYSTTITYDEGMVGTYKPKQRGFEYRGYFTSDTTRSDGPDYISRTDDYYTSEDWQRRPHSEGHNPLDEGRTSSQKFGSTHWDGTLHRLLKGVAPDYSPKWNGQSYETSDDSIIDYSGGSVVVGMGDDSWNTTQTGLRTIWQDPPPWVGTHTNAYGNVSPYESPSVPFDDLDGGGYNIFELWGPVGFSYANQLSATGISETSVTRQLGKEFGQSITLTDTLSEPFTTKAFIDETIADMVYPDEYAKNYFGWGAYPWGWWGPYGGGGNDPSNVQGTWYWVASRDLDAKEESFSVNRIKYQFETNPTVPSSELTWCEVFIPRGYGTDGYSGPPPKVINVYTFTDPVVTGEIDPTTRLNEDGTSKDGNGDYFIVFSPVLTGTGADNQPLDLKEKVQEGIVLTPTQVPVLEGLANPSAPRTNGAGGTPPGFSSAPAATQTVFEGTFTMDLTVVPGMTYTFYWDDPAVSLLVPFINLGGEGYFTVKSGDALNVENLFDLTAYPRGGVVQVTIRYQMDPTKMTKLNSSIRLVTTPSDSPLTLTLGMSSISAYISLPMELVARGYADGPGPNGEPVADGDLVPSIKTDGTGQKHFVVPKKAGAFVSIEARVSGSTVEGVEFDKLYEWALKDGAAAAVAGAVITGNIIQVPRAEAKQIMVELRTKDSAHTTVASLNVWVVSAVGSIVQPGTFYSRTVDALKRTDGNFGRGVEVGIYTSHPWRFKFAIQPVSIADKTTDIPNLTGDKEVGGDGQIEGERVHFLAGIQLKTGATLRWDTSRRISFRVLNPNGIPSGRLQAATGPVYRNNPLFPADSTVEPYPTNPLVGNDDVLNQASDNNPYDAFHPDPTSSDATLVHKVGEITSRDRPRLTFPIPRNSGEVAPNEQPEPMYADGTTFEEDVSFQEFARLQIGNVWYDITEQPVLWNVHFKWVVQGGNIVNASTTGTGN